MSTWINEFGIALTVDTSGHAHKGKGVGGGQFTKKTETREEFVAAEIERLRKIYPNNREEIYQGQAELNADNRKLLRSNSSADDKANSTKSKAFKAWFGDWENDPESASKVVKTDGSPQETHGTAKKVYHGRLVKFNKFDKSKRGQIGANAGLGYYFAENKELASGFARAVGTPIHDPGDYDDEDDDEDQPDFTELVTNEADYLLECYLSIKKPFDLDVPSNLAEFNKMKPHEASDILQGRGYDGTVYTASDEFGSVRQNPNRPSSFGRCWVAFEPNQIKLVDSAGFDPSTDDITMTLDATRILQECLAESNGDINLAIDAATYILGPDIPLGMVGDEWHGPKPPGPNWSPIAPGPRKGKRWKKVSGQSSAAPAPALPPPPSYTPKPLPGTETPETAPPPSYTPKPLKGTTPRVARPKVARQTVPKAVPKAIPLSKQQVLGLVQGAMKAATPVNIKSAIDGLMSLKLAEMRQVLAATGSKGKGKSKSDLAKLVESAIQKPQAAPQAPAAQAASGKRLTKPSDSKVFADYIKSDEDVNSLYLNSAGGQDKFMAKVNKETGFDAKPTVVSKEELDAHIAAGGHEMFRGVGRDFGDPNHTKHAQYVDQFKGGDFFAGLGGYGNGTYAAVQKKDDPHRAGYRMARQYAGDNDNGMMRMSVKKDAKTIAYTDVADAIKKDQARLDAEYKTAKPKRQLEIKKEAFLLSDHGRWAQLHGYDMLTLGTPEDASMVTVILNRGVVMVQKEPVTEKEYDPETAKWALPPKQHPSDDDDAISL